MNRFRLGASTYVACVVALSVVGAVTGNGLLVGGGILLAAPVGLVAGPLTFVFAGAPEAALGLSLSGSTDYVIASIVTGLVYGAAAVGNLVVLRQLRRSLCRRQPQGA